MWRKKLIKPTKTEGFMLLLTLIFLSALALLYGKAADTAQGVDYTITITQREKETVTPEAPAPVNLNTATAQELDSLPGIGPVIAQRIIDYRVAHGSFRTVEELLNVKGIGEATLEQLRDLVSVPSDQN